MNQQQKQSFHLDEKIEQMDPKLKKLFLNMTSVFTIFALIYGLISFIVVYLDTNSFTAWFGGSEFITVAVVLVLVGIGQKILKGGKITVPEQYKKGNQNTQFNMPNTWGVKTLKQKPQQQETQPKQPVLHRKPAPKPITQGAWQCPQCGEFTIGQQCRRCGFVKQ